MDPTYKFIYDSYYQYYVWTYEPVRMLMKYVMRSWWNVLVWWYDAYKNIGVRQFGFEVMCGDMGIELVI